MESSLLIKLLTYSKWLQQHERFRRFCKLSAIEAAMCGAKLYVPKYGWNRTFLGGDLLKNGVAYSIFCCNSKSIVSTFLKDMKNGFEREKIYKTTSERNSWKLAAERIHKELSI